MKEKLLILNHLAKKKNSKMPGLILIFQCEIHIFFTFIPVLLVQGYHLGSHSVCFSLSVVEGPAAPSRTVCWTDSMKYWVFRVPRLCLSHHLVCYMVYTMDLLGL